MAQSMRRLVHAAILAVVVMLFTAPVQHAFAALTAAQTAATLEFLQEFPKDIPYLATRWTGTDYCSWEGVTCDATTGYVSVNLAGKGLTGDMPQLESRVDGSQVMITSIDMSNNPYWNDDFEDSWSRLTNLQYLDLSNTALKGDIPDQWTGMSALQTVKISNTYACKTLPSWNIASLRTIDLSNNAFSGSLPVSWGYMTGLTSVNLAGVYPCGCVPSTWTSSVLVDAAAAIGSGVSASTCATLNTCNNNNNDHCLNYQAAAAGMTVAQRHTLVFLQKFPEDLSYLATRWTGVNYCSWEGVTCDSTTGDVSIDLSGKGLVGSMPELESHVDGWHVQVVSIDMSHNPAWSDDFEEDWGYLRNLKKLDLSYTALHDDIPDRWTGMRSLEEIRITNAAACKSLPEWNIPTLRVVDFSNNNLQGSLSASWSQMTSLTSVNIAGNDFCGCVPTTWTASVLSNAAAAAGGALQSSTCATANACTLLELRCQSTPLTTSTPTDTTAAPTTVAPTTAAPTTAAPTTAAPTTAAPTTASPTTAAPTTAAPTTAAPTTVAPTTAAPTTAAPTTAAPTTAAPTTAAPTTTIVPDVCYVANCAQCYPGYPNICYVCNSGYNRRNDGSCMISGLCEVQHCTQCSYTDPTECTLCNDGYDLNSQRTCSRKRNAAAGPASLLVAAAAVLMAAAAAAY